MRVFMNESVGTEWVGTKEGNLAQAYCVSQLQDAKRHNCKCNKLPVYTRAKLVFLLLAPQFSNLLCTKK